MRRVEGAARRAFTFLDPTDNLLCWSEKLDESVWERNSLLTITAGIADPNGGTNATRVSNTGSGALSIQQTVNGPGWFQYAFGVQARSDVRPTDCADSIDGHADAVGELHYWGGLEADCAVGEV